MPTTITALIIIIFAVLPGLPAEKVYRIFAGKDWRDTDWDRVIGVIGFSLGGLLVYIVISSITCLPPPVYVIPSTFGTSFGASSLLPIAIPFIGHTVSSVIVVVIIVFAIRIVSKWIPISPFPSAWDDFVRSDVPDHWVVVRFTNGDTYAGILKYADTSVIQSERDIVLSEPAQFNEKENNYKVIPYKELFIPASLISSIAIVHDPVIDKRISTIESNLFPEEEND